MKRQIEGPTNYKEFTVEVFKQSQAIIENSNCSTFKLMGYKYLDQRLILNFNDCNQVFDFTFNREVMEVESFFTKDQTHEEMIEGMKRFEAERKLDVPENK